MNPLQVMTEQTVPTDAILHWATLIAKAAVLHGFVDVDSEARNDIPRAGFRTVPAKGHVR